jgi:glucan phosphoethanolaminetransferase (alkaline phosphatase superfamily)
MIGGLFWAVKAAALMTTRVQPPIIYEIAPLFFPIAVVGLYALLNHRRSRLALAGLASACAAELAAVVSVLGLFLGPAEWTPTSSTGSRPVTVLTPFIALAAYGALLGLLLIGIITRRTASLPGKWAALPMFLAATALPLIVLGVVLQAINERLFELPTLLIGLEWLALGAAMVRRSPLRR